MQIEGDVCFFLIASASIDRMEKVNYKNRRVYVDVTSHLIGQSHVTSSPIGRL
jgi:hypothetical protein